MRRTVVLSTQLEILQRQKFCTRYGA